MPIVGYSKVFSVLFRQHVNVPHNTLHVRKLNNLSSLGKWSIRTSKSKIWVRRLGQIRTNSRCGTISIRLQLESLDHEIGAGLCAGTLQYNSFIVLQSRKILVVPARL